VWLLGERAAGLDASQFLLILHGRKEGRPPQTDLAAEVAIQQTLRDAIREGLIRSAHDCAEGGIAVALAECCISGEQPVGADITLPDDKLRDDETLFHEAPGRILVSVAPEHEAALEKLFTSRNLPVRQIGKTGGDSLAIQVRANTFRWPVADLHRRWDSSLGDLMGTVAEPLAAH
jgi:phosphoribosylformylglycinamidine synthase